MYLEFTTKQLNEYNKLIKMIESCETAEHYDNTVIIMRSFGKICDNRKRILRNYAIKGLLRFNSQPIDEYYKYKEATMEQIKTLINYSNAWLEQYEAWEKRQEAERVAKGDQREDKIDVVGFAKLLKKKERNELV